MSGNLHVMCLLLRSNQPAAAAAAPLTKSTQSTSQSNQINQSRLVCGMKCCNVGEEVGIAGEKTSNQASKQASKGR